MDTTLPKQAIPGTNGNSGSVTSPSNDSPNSSTPLSPQSSVQGAREGGKEHEPVSASVNMEAIGLPEEAITDEVKEMGVEVYPETIEVPPALQKLGVSASGPSQTVVHQGASGTTTIALPISDDQVVKGLHASIASSLRWLAEWCVRQLKEGHVALKVIHGKVFRIHTGDRREPKKPSSPPNI